MFKFASNPEGVSVGAQMLSIGRKREKATIRVLLCPSLGLLVVQTLPRQSVFSSQPLTLRHISVALICSGPSTSKNKYKREIVNPKSPTVNVFISCFAKPRIWFTHCPIANKSAALAWQRWTFPNAFPNAQGNYNWVRIKGPFYTEPEAPNRTILSRWARASEEAKIFKKKKRKTKKKKKYKMG